MRQSIANPTDPIAVYSAALHKTVMSIALRTRRFDDAQDIAQSVVLGFLRSPQRVMADYPTPERYAAVRTRHAMLDWQRSERTQRCEGARITRDSSGDFRKSREWVSGSLPVGESGGELFDHVGAAVPSIDDGVVNGVEARRLLEVLTGALSAGDRDLLLMVDGLAIPITEVAQQVGRARETINRRVSAARAVVRSMAERLDHAA